MKQYIHILVIVNCIAAIHGVFLSFILWTKKMNRKANHILAVMVLIYSIGMLGPVYVFTGIYVKLWWLSPFFNALPYTFGPLVYFYIRALTAPTFRFKAIHLLHALPLSVAAVYYSSVYFMTGEATLEFLESVYFLISPVSFASILVSLFQALIYLLLCLKLLKIHAQKIKQSYSDLEKVNLSWIRHLVSLFILIWLVSASLQSFLPEELLTKKLDDAITYFLLSLFIFTIGYRGLSQPEIFDLQPQEASPQSSPTKIKKYEKTGLSQKKSVSVKEQLLVLMETERLFLNPTLTLPQTAEKLNLPVHQLSQVINDNMGQNFYRFINGYRVEEAKQRLKDARTAEDKLIKIAFDAGFNSLSTFNRVFKDFTGHSPSQFRSQMLSET